MSIFADQKRALAFDFGLLAVLILLWAILPTDIFRHLYFIAHLFILSVILPVAIYAALALREQGKRTLFCLAAGTIILIVVSIAVLRYLDAKLMGTGIWF